MKLLVTGGAGFIGSNFIRYWAREHPSDSIVNLDLLTYAGDLTTVSDAEHELGDRYVFAQGDIADPAFVDETVDRQRPDIIVNFAAESHNSRAILDPTVFLRTNVLGTQTLLEAARRHAVARFHHISTCEVYGDLELDSPESFTEESPYRPRTPYNASKAAADMMVRVYHLTYGLATTISNSANNYGPWQYPEKVIPLFTTNALDDMQLPLYRQSQNRREWLHVDDHCQAVDLILRNGRIGETYNVGSGDERSIEQIADGVLETLGKPTSLKRYVDDRPSHDRRYLLDHSKIERELGWKPRVSFDVGLRATIAWYRDHRSWWERKRSEAQAALNEFAWTKTASVESRR
jgi:dTDP-glucose 4,6-dehydratase